MDLKYDQLGDVLYITIQKTKVNCKYVEVDDGIVLRVTPRAKRVASCTIVDFAKRASQGKLRIPDLIRKMASTKESGA